jgi:hypothetical protein
MAVLRVVSCNSVFRLTDRGSRPARQCFRSRASPVTRAHRRLSLRERLVYLLSLLFRLFQHMAVVTIQVQGTDPAIATISIRPGHASQNQPFRGGGGHALRGGQSSRRVASTPRGSSRAFAGAKGDYGLVSPAKPVIRTMSSGPACHFHDRDPDIVSSPEMHSLDFLDP